MDPAQQRPIFLTNCWLRILDKLVYKRLRDHVDDNDILSDNQAGFRAQHSCTHQIVVLEQIVQIETQQGNAVHGCLIDIRKAFDSIHRGQLFRILKDESFPPDVIEVLKAMYRTETSRLILDNKPMHKWPVKIGVR